MTLAADEFIRRFLLHVLPKGLPSHPPLRATGERQLQGQHRPRQEVDGCSNGRGRSAGSARHRRSRRHDRSSPAVPVLWGPHDHCRGLCPRRRTARPALRRWHPDLIPMTFLPVPWYHPFARTFRSRRRDHFTLVPANTGTTSRTSPRSGHRAPQQRPPRCHHRRSALGDRRKTIHGYSRSDVKSP